MRGHFAGVRAAVFSAAVLVGLVFVGTALAVTVTSFTPTSGLPNKAGACPGGTIQISGTGFANDGPASSVVVKFNGVPTQPGGLQIGSDNTLYAVVPDGATNGPITVTTAAGTVTAAGTFYVNPCPQVGLAAAIANPSSVQGTVSTPSIYKLNPASGKVGAKLVIRGTNLAAVTSVHFSPDVKAKFQLLTPTTIGVTVPKGAKTGKLAFFYSISGSNSNGGINPDPSKNVGSGASTATQYSPNSFKITG
jgi:hypothetical protein